MEITNDKGKIEEVEAAAAAVCLQGLQEDVISTVPEESININTG